MLFLSFTYIDIMHDVTYSYGINQFTPISYLLYISDIFNIDFGAKNLSWNWNFNRGVMFFKSVNMLHNSLSLKYIYVLVIPYIFLCVLHIGRRYLLYYNMLFLNYYWVPLFVWVSIKHFLYRPLNMESYNNNNDYDLMAIILNNKKTILSMQWIHYLNPSLKTETCCPKPKR